MPLDSTGGGRGGRVSLRTRLHCRGRRAGGGRGVGVRNWWGGGEGSLLIFYKETGMPRGVGGRETPDRQRL
jgi:hypothetical protein